MTLSEFQRALKREFHDDIRIRWSYPRQAYLIETKAGRGVWDAPVATQPYRQQDEAIALRDGYKFFMEVRLGTRTTCLGCDLEGTIPAFKPVQFVCPRCGYIQAVAFFPLGDTLLDHLRMLNPKGTYRDRVIAELDRENRKREEALARDTDN